MRRKRKGRFVQVKPACTLRAGIADGGELEFGPPGTAAWLFDKVKY